MQDRAYTEALAQVEQRLKQLPERLGGEDAATLSSRVSAGTAALRGAADGVWTHERAVNLAAMAVALVAALERTKA